VGPELGKSMDAMNKQHSWTLTRLSLSWHPQDRSTGTQATDRLLNECDIKVLLPCFQLFVVFWSKAMATSTQNTKNDLHKRTLY
jgi:hypothetical protein